MRRALSRYPVWERLRTRGGKPSPAHGTPARAASPAESDLSHSSDDYRATEEAKARARQRRLANGGRVSPSLEDEDAEDEEEFEGVVAANGLTDED